MLVHGKTSALHFADSRDHHKAVRINAVRDFFQLVQLSVGNHAEDHLGFVMQIPAFRVQKRHSPVKLL